MERIRKALSFKITILSVLLFDSEVFAGRHHAPIACVTGPELVKLKSGCQNRLLLFLPPLR